MTAALVVSVGTGGSGAVPKPKTGMIPPSWASLIVGTAGVLGAMGGGGGDRRCAVNLISFSGREKCNLDGLEMGTEGLKKRRWDHDK